VSNFIIDNNYVIDTVIALGTEKIIETNTVISIVLDNTPNIITVTNTEPEPVVESSDVFQVTLESQGTTFL
jgi:hypothetical protein